VEFSEWIRRRLGEDAFTLLLVKASKPRKPLDQFTAEQIEKEFKNA
jgi:hypothetical protein